MNLVLDLGNTKVKAAVFSDQEEAVELFTWESIDAEKISHVKSKYLIDSAILCTVVKDTAEIEKYLESNIPYFLKLSHNTKLPIKNKYTTPETLGLDRIAAAVGANLISPNTPLLVIDMGTAITYDYVSELNEYIGGNIAPGLNMRLKAMNKFTKKLPLLDPKPEDKLLGVDTESAMMAGVFRGIEFEIDGYISRISEKKPNLSVFLTGGDVFFFEKRVKSSIFVVSNLLLIGLNRILNYNKCILKD